MKDLYDKQEAITEFQKLYVDTQEGTDIAAVKINVGITKAIHALQDMKPVQPERDIPIKPIEVIAKAWGTPCRKAVCPKCDYYLGHVIFFDDYEGKKITYCETCGQAIDWEGWNFDE